MSVATGSYPHNRVAGRTALVTGAGNGLGRAITLALAEVGARVLLVGRTPETLEAVLTEVSAIGGTGRVAICDAADHSAVARLRNELADESISILVNNAGVAGPVAPLIEVEPDDWDAVFASNVRGVYLMCRAFIPGMVARGSGDVINLASVSGKRPLVRRTPYVASKMAVIGLSTTLAHEVGPLGVNVNTLSPGPVRGPRMERNFNLEAARAGITVDEARDNFVSRAALNRMVEEDEVAAAIIAMLHMPGLCAADIDLSAGMVAR
jgi:NAD(P)-dependent dehydrogenase (short-subunit alcohol dehydrogenase family)